MSYQALQKKKTRLVNPRAGEKRTVEGELAHIAGLERVPSRDPVHHLIEHSRSMFDMLGRVNAEKMADPDKMEFDAVNQALNESGAQKKSEKLVMDEGIEKDASGKNKDEAEGGEQRPDGAFYKKFSEVAFNKGKLLTAVGEGGGKTMMASCIRQTIDQSPPVDARQTKVRDKGATQMRIPDSRASLSYHRYTRGALNLVVDTAQNLTRTLMVLERMAQGEVDDRLGIPDIDTAYRMYPFLNTKPDIAKLEAYRAELRGLPDGEKKRALEYGVNRLNSMISHKKRMRQDFLVSLRKMLADSRRAEEIFSQPKVEEDIVKELMETEADGEDGNKGQGKGKKDKR